MYSGVTATSADTAVAKREITFSKYITLYSVKTEALTDPTISLRSTVHVTMHTTEVSSNSINRNVASKLKLSWV